MDTLYGFQLIKRTPERPRKRYAATWVRVRYADAARAAGQSRLAAQQQAAMLMHRLRGGQVSMAELGAQHAVKGPMSWWEGREAPAIEAALAETSLGDLVAHPIESNDSFLIAQRLAPEPPVEAAVQ